MIMNKIAEAKKKYTDWCRSIGIDSVGELNRFLEERGGIELINLCEAKQERDYADIADMIKERGDKAKIVMMAGPSSSDLIVPQNRSPMPSPRTESQGHRAGQLFRGPRADPSRT